MLNSQNALRTLLQSQSLQYANTREAMMRTSYDTRGPKLKTSAPCASG